MTTAPPSDSRAAASAQSPPLSRRSVLIEALVLFAISTTVCAVLHFLRFLPLVQEYLHTLVAAVFIYLPTALLIRRRLELSRFGITPFPIPQNLLWAGLAMLVVLPIFAVGFVFFQKLLCQLGFTSAGLCARLEAGLSHFRFSFPPLLDFGQRVLVQITVVAIPEELFYRGYLMTRLDEVFPPRIRLLGALVGPALILQAILFGLGHFLVDFDPRRLGVAFPALLFGWLRARTGSIGAAALFHAACNLAMELMVRSAFRIP